METTPVKIDDGPYSYSYEEFFDQMTRIAKGEPLNPLYNENRSKYRQGKMPEKPWDRKGQCYSPK